MNEAIADNSDNDIEIIKHQLKTDNVSIAEVVSRCDYGYPTVIIMDPTNNSYNSTYDGKLKEADYGALSNVIWLTCPFLNERIHDLESQGYIKKINDFINEDKSLESMMFNAHANYYYLRKRIHRKYIGNPAINNKNSEIMKTGIGGLKNIEHIKCLHMHYAHYSLCSSNVAGRIVCSLLEGKTVCSEVMCANRS